MAFKVVVSDKDVSYQVEVDDGKQLNGLKIGEEFDGQIVGLDGYTLKITGGSDKNGFTMKKDVDGPRRITISDDIVQINTIVTKAGSKTISEILNPEEEAEE